MYCFIISIMKVLNEFFVIMIKLCDFYIVLEDEG